MVHIPSIFKGYYLKFVLIISIYSLKMVKSLIGSNFRNYAKEFSSQERLNRENARLAVLKIQRLFSEFLIRLRRVLSYLN